MFKFFLVILTCWLTSSCEKKSPEFISTSTPAVARFLALGDSYTIGEGVNIQERFPYLAVNLLRQANIQVSDPEYIATTGWTTRNLINAIDERNPRGPYDIVTLLIGVNDQYQRLDTTSYRTNFKQLLITAIKLAGNRPSRVFVLSIPDYSATPFVHAGEKNRVSKEIDWFNAINKEITIQSNVVYTDITPSTRLAGSDFSLLADDRLHYSAKEHVKWAEILVPKIKAVF